MKGTFFLNLLVSRREIKKKKKERCVQTIFQNRTSKQLPHINPRNA